ncbi:AraC family transcriptional regulator [Salipaludibacillus neizhouensis]|uniref:AraC family transcriptional regulator n=1 Tax=Salipaludibacillus neizhouensis TaxID=885475 RepID=A0A3A9K8K9_9BACI|nr:AraC family transcriptional regulator [Salipaludibacillus neizhouensis]RKL66862.1 AraC family transcriptional regulator [Salipaludibacillus neizhouensis]
MKETSLYQTLSREREVHPEVTFYYFKQWSNYEMSEAHAHEAIEIMYVLSGKAQVEIEQDSFMLKEGQFILIDSLIAHRLIAKSSIPCRMLNVEFTWKSKEGSFPSLKDLAKENDNLLELLKTPISFLLLQDGNDIATTLKRLVLELDSKVSNPIMVQLMFTELFLQIATLKKSDATFSSQLKNRNVYIKKAVEYIHHHYDRPLLIDDIAEVIHLNASYLQRIFKTEMGCTIMQYLTSIRIEKAKMLLRNSVIPITEISEYIGLNSRQHFSYLFKKETGYSPSKFRGDIELKR